MSDSDRNEIVPDTHVEAQPSQLDGDPEALEQLDDLQDVDFLLEEVENKIAPLALA